ncbi:16S rRNA (guanine(527)-N(7))-methyltransferase RsmG [Deinococcus fonticola]|uniref:16S rRNA (guanine(527)-N(7))-methyltransferase RsmG n=1 Tax=Deinococcus fonticola TaxID=2528713 RepID=UPI0010757668|nr:16S rRNA (guanine(527)-N(7))-methyltransferase RsmG [Deinococcus fonticola]
MTGNGEALLLGGAAALGIKLEAEQVAAFRQLYALLLEGNARLNLTALKTEQDIVLKHFVDSLSCLRGYHLDTPAKVLDLGTGGGFPSLPLAIARPTLELVPMDATRKKIDFVRETAHTLGLSRVTPVVGRAETLGRDPELRAQHDRVVARAVSALPILVELALPFLKVGGLLLAQKGALSGDELDAGAQAALEVGGRIQEVDEFTLPSLGDARTLVVVEKIRATPPRYPRRDGLPNQQPLFWTAKG